MAYKWDSKYLINVKILDKQHQELFRLLNELYELPNHSGCDENLNRILGELIDYASEHLDLEEAMMREYHYPETEQHQREHDSFRREVERQLALFKEKKLNIFDLIVFIQDWLTSHIMYSDYKMGIYLNLEGVN
jgi:hemerythrin